MKKRDAAVKASPCMEAARLPYLSYRVNGAAESLAALCRELKNPQGKIRLEAGGYFSPAGAQSFFLVRTGRLRLEYADGSGFERPLLVYEPGALLNVCSALQNVAPQWTYACLEDCLLWEMDANCLRDAQCAAKFPLLWQAALRNCASLILTYGGALTFLGNSSFRIRFCRYLLLNVKRCGRTSFTTGLTQAQCAATLGACRATLLRCVADLKSEGVLGEFSRRKIEILDEARLVENCRL